ncbi:MAG: alkaline shock response membrane anchor protein AmaP [Candidatus Omnitrophica bacterium]|nr:alkaline shock response membrane anchor protein AmaP [Candidatus Omnitrophota bacterium]
MRLIRSLVIIMHTLLFVIIGGVCLLLSLNLLSSDELANAINYIYTDPNVQLALGVAGGMFILIGLLLAYINLGRLQGEKTIAFENPEGQVTVSLSAIEDFIKKSVRHLSEVKELRADVTASKKGINIVCRATIFADSNIPETTERLQNIVKSKVRDMLGVEETINIKIHVTKISSTRGKGEVQQTPKENAETSRRLPLGGLE